ncbi:C3 and PZP-like, alpha-2-macroglobulin domain containing 8 [Chamberlinius hualienensis]
MKALISIGFLATIWVLAECRRDSQNGYILTAPGIFDSNSTEKICLTLSNFKDGGILNVKLETGNKIIAEQQHHLKESSSCFHLQIGETSEKEALLSISGTFKSGYKISNKKNVKIRQSADLIIVQTDKHIYKPGQKVQFRVLHLTSDLLPSSNPIRSIFIENPTNISVYQWISPSFTKGIADLNFQLSDYPEFGTWTVAVVDKFSHKVNRTFIVDEYVLPEFSVKITPPTTISSDFRMFNWKVCAYYTYGEPVTGYIKANASFNEIKNRESISLTTYQDEFNECRTITVLKKSLNVNNAGFLNFHAEITEKGTGNVMSDFKQKEIKSPHLILYFLSKQYFKPGLIYHGKLLVEKSDGTPMQGIELEIETSIFGSRGTVTKSKHNLKSNEKGLIEFEIASKRFDEMFLTQITRKSHETQIFQYIGFNRINGTEIKTKDTISDYIKSWFSSSGSYIQIERTTETVKCHQDLVLTIKYTAENLNDITENIYYQIMSKGHVVNQNAVSTTKINSNQQLNSKENSFQMSLRVDAKLSPKFEIVIYYIRYDGEIVSDSETFEVEQCFANKVDMKFNQPRVLPGSRVNMQLSADPNSLCATGVTDLSTRLMSDYEFNDHTVFTKLRKQYPTESITREDTACHKFDPQLGRFVRNKRLLGSIVAFDTIGLLTMTDLKLDSSPCQPRQIGTGARKMFSAFNFDMIDEDMTKILDQMDQFKEERYDEKSIPATEMRNFFPETWLWDLIPIGHDGQVTVEREIPHTITKWTGNTFCISTQNGFGISPQTSIIGFQPVFLSIKMPYAVKLGETVAVIVSVFNYLKGCFPMVIALEQIHDFKLVSQSNEIKFCVCGRKSHSHKYYIEPVKVGYINVTARAHSLNAQTSSVCKDETFVSHVMAYDSITKPLLVQTPGVPKETSKSGWICDNGHQKTYQYPIEVPSESIPETVRSYVTVTGDLVAPTIGNIDKLIALPKGCGEQNLLKLAPLTFLLHYLNSTKQLTPDIEKKAISYLTSGFQNQLRFKHRDGSYSIWGAKDTSGSSWLTAFVMKSFYQARNMIYIDPQLITDGTQFLLKHQMTNGCFREPGKVAYKRLQGGIGAGEKTPQAETLFITISLLESGFDSSNNVIKKAFECIQSDTQPNLYRLVMQAYAAALAKQNNLALSILKQLEPKAVIQGDTAHWTPNQNSDRAIMIEVTSYVLLAMTTLPNYHSDLTIKAVRWLVNKRNSHGGFESTQDTVLALQALDKYAGKLSTKTADVKILLQSDRLREEIFINQENRLYIHKRNLPTSSKTVKVEITGHGCALIQIVTQYSTKGNHVSSAFFLDITVSPYTHHNYINRENKQTIKVCTKYTNSDGKSNMAMIEIQIISGYEADSSHLNKLINPGTAVRKWEKGRDNTIILYLNELDHNLQCISVLVTEKTEVLQRKPATITVYDYYRPSLRVSKEYSLLATSSKRLTDDSLIFALM